jgi:Zn2+/Cd2+-exporting ATPase
MTDTGIETPSELNRTAERRVFKVRGMDCAEEVAVLKDVVGPVVGGASRLSFDILNGRMTVAAEAAADDFQVKTAVAKTGMQAERWNEQGRDERADNGRRLRKTLTAISGAFTLAGFGTHAALAGSIGVALGSEGAGLAYDVPWPSRFMYAIAIACGARFVAPKAWFAVRRLRPDMNLLMTIAVVGAVLIGEWFEAATVSFLFALSLALEAWSVSRARHAVAALMALSPTVVRVLEDGGVVERAPADVAVGTSFSVRPGDKVPLDGRVLRGMSEVNQAPITGESVPVLKQTGDAVFAGSINGDGALEVESTKPAGDTTLAHIVRLVGEAQSQRSPSEMWVERFARTYTPSVFVVAIVVALLPPLLFAASWSEWTYRALVLLVIGCPCALVISTPVTVVAALASAARNGILIKGGIFVEAPARLQAIALDKTGTLTTGRPTVIEIVPLADHTEDQLLSRAAGLEVQADHPLARAIVEHARGRNVPLTAVVDLRVFPGKGAQGRIDGRDYWLGSYRYLEERARETPELHDAIERRSRAGQTVVVVGSDHHVCGLIALADAVRPESSDAIRQLKVLGIKSVVMLTGDNRPAAEVIAAHAGVDEVRAELLPEDKVSVIADLVSRHGMTAMVGDGINDAPALARASIGIAMGVAGSDAAIETADIALLADDLRKIPWLIRHSRRAATIIRQNITLSLAVKALFVLLTFAGHASLWAAIAADMGVTFVVVANALRLLRDGDGMSEASPARLARGQK